MEQLRRIVTFYSVIVIGICIVALRYVYKMRKNNPWWKDDDTKCSPSARAYRQQKRQKEKNVFFLCMAAVVVFMFMMIMHLYLYGIGRLPAESLRFVPLVLLIVLCLANIKKR